MNTSIGFHTFSFFQKVDEFDFDTLKSDFAAAYYKGDTGIDRVFTKKHTPIYMYKTEKGIRWVLVESKTDNGFKNYGVCVIINPKALISKDYITACDERDVEIIEKIYNERISKISPILGKFGMCAISRSDPCINIDLAEVGISCSCDQMMELIRRGNIPKRYKERKSYDKVQRREVPDKGQLYLVGKSTNINCYQKYHQQGEKHPNYAHRREAENVIRFEVQCHYPKLYAISREKKEQSKFNLYNQTATMEEEYDLLAGGFKSPSIPADIILANEVTGSLCEKYFNEILRKGDYFTLDIAERIIKSYNYRREKEERLLFMLNIVSESKGISKAESKLSGLDLRDFKKSLRDLDDILVNPVTIPRRWGITHIQNLYRAVNDLFYEEQLIPASEYSALKHINEILMEKNNKYVG